MDSSEIEFTITTWISQSGELYQYNSTIQTQRQQFRANKFKLPMVRSSPIYYFFHLIKKKSKDDCYEYILQRRKELKSDLSQHRFEIKSLLLVGGIKVYKKAFNNKIYVFIQPIQANKIQRTKVDRNYEECSNNLPFLVVRTFTNGYPIRANQMIKFGKLQYDVLQINTDKEREVEYGFQNNQILNLDELQKYSSLNPTENQNSQSVVKKLCKVCYVPQQSQQNALITPCNCKGSGKFIHIDCLKTWIHQKLKKMKDQAEGAFYHTNQLFCEICKQNFPKAIIKNKKVIGLLKFLQESYPYIALRSKMKTTVSQDSMYYVSFQETNRIGVGRLLQNGVILEQQTVSRSHAQFHMNQKQIRLRDVGSKYGTLIYEQNMQIKVKNKLKAFQIGNAVFSFKLISESY